MILIGLKSGVAQFNFFEKIHLMPKLSITFVEGNVNNRVDQRVQIR